MRTVILAAVLVLPLAVSFACKPKAGSGGDAAAEASASASASASAADTTTTTPSATNTSVVRWTPHDAGGDAAPSSIALGASCTPKDGYSGFACAPDGVTELTCTAGKWAVQQACKGPGACKQDSSGVHCDTGTVKPGDPCPAGAPASCNNAQNLFSCVNGKWTVSLCAPPAKCQVVGGTAKCK
jgi:hypothetical protein